MALRDLFQTKKVALPVVPEQGQNIEDKYQVRKLNYKKLGIMDAGAAHGDSTPLEASIKAAAGKIQNELENDHDLQESERNKIRKEIEQLKANKENAESEKRNAEDKLRFEQNKIEEAKAEIADIRNHPEKIQKNPATQASFFIGLLILIPLTLYLFIYYISASYSAIFKTFSTNTATVTQNVLDPNALSNALQEGVGAFAFVILIPFVFLGLGYLIHKFSEQEGRVKYFKIIALVAITFIFDALIAYKIEEASYNCTKLADITGTMPDYNFNMAFKNPDFWLIIFLGFIVYIMWGFVFDFVMDAYEKLDKVHTAIKEIENKIAHYKEQCNHYQSTIHEKELEIQQLAHSIESKNADLQMVRYPRNILLDCLNSYLSGWLQYLASIGAWTTTQNEAKSIGEATIAKYAK